MFKLINYICIPREKRPHKIHNKVKKKEDYYEEYEFLDPE